MDEMEKKGTLTKNCGISPDISVKIIAILLSGKMEMKKHECLLADVNGIILV